MQHLPLAGRLTAVAAAAAAMAFSVAAPASAAADRTAPTKINVAVTEATAPDFQHTAGNAVYLNPQKTGSFLLTVGAVDPESGVASVTFPKMLGAGAWTDRKAPFARTYTWPRGATSPGWVRLQVANRAGLISSASLSVLTDATPPGPGALVKHPTGDLTSASVTGRVQPGPGDAGSGLARRTLRRDDGVASGSCTATQSLSLAAVATSGSWTDGSLKAGRCYRYSLVEVDQVGNLRRTVGPGAVNVVNVVNAPPVAQGATVSTPKNTPVTVRLDGRDPEGAVLTPVIVTPPVHGSLSGTGASRTYTPATNFTGTDVIVFDVSDGASTSAPAEVRITVSAVNAAPVAADSALTVPGGASSSLSLIARDPDGDALTYTVVQGPTHGSLSGSGAQRTYTPAAGFSGADSVRFTASDGVTSSAPATVSVTVAAPTPKPEPTPAPEPGPMPTPPAPSSEGRWHLTAAFQQEQPASQHGGALTDAAAAAQARAFDLLTVQSKSVSGGTATTPPTKVVPIYTRANIAAMRAVNARFRIGPYVNGGTTANPNLPEQWYAHTASGSRVVNTDWGTRYVMQPDNLQWRAYLRDYALAVYSSSDYDDLFIDVLGDYPLSLRPVKPGTQTVYTTAEWYAMTKGVAATLQAALPAGARAIPNGLAHGGKYPVSKALLTGSASAMAEIFSRTASAPSTSPTTGQDVQVRSLAAWQAELTMIEDLNATGRVGTLMVKDWTGDAAAEERVKYGFATAMLATNGTHYLGVSLGQPTTMRTYAWLSGIDYGRPQGPYSVNGGGVYERVFSKATVAVNPTESSWTGTVRGKLVTIPSRRSRFVVDPA